MKVYPEQMAEHAAEDYEYQVADTLLKLLNGEIEAVEAKQDLIGTMQAACEEATDKLAKRVRAGHAIADGED